MAGKAGEYLACFDLLYKGFNAFPSDQGLPFDIIVERDGKLYRGQVKSVRRMYKYYIRNDGKLAHSVYRFTTRYGSVRKNRVAELKVTDFYAFVVLPKKIVAYMWVKDLVSKNTGKINQLVEFKDRDCPYHKDGMGRRVLGKYIQDFTEFKVPE